MKDTKKTTVADLYTLGFSIGEMNRATPRILSRRETKCYGEIITKIGYRNKEDTILTPDEIVDFNRFYIEINTSAVSCIRVKDIDDLIKFMNYF